MVTGRCSLRIARRSGPFDPSSRKSTAHINVGDSAATRSQNSNFPYRHGILAYGYLASRGLGASGSGGKDEAHFSFGESPRGRSPRVHVRGASVGRSAGVGGGGSRYLHRES